MKFKGKSIRVSHQDNLQLLVEDIEQVDGGLVSDTRNGKIEIVKTKPLPEEIGLKICKDYIITIREPNAEEPVLHVSRMELDKGLDLITYTLKNLDTTVTLSLPKDFETDFALEKGYYIYWEETN